MAVLVLLVGVLLASGCNSVQQPIAPSAAPPVASPAPAPVPAPEPQPPASPPPSPPAFPRYRVSGRVTDDAGVAVPFAQLELAYVRADNAGPDCRNLHGCWRIVEADATGSYQLEFEPGARGWQNAVGLLHSLHRDYEINTQIVPDGSNVVVVNLRLRRVHTLVAAESTSVDVGPDSTRCTDSEDIWALDSRCEVLRVVTDRPGTLLITARAPGASGDGPRMFSATSGNYGNPEGRRSEPGAIYIPVRGGTYLIFVAVPDGLPVQRFEIATSLQ